MEIIKNILNIYLFISTDSETVRLPYEVSQNYSLIAFSKLNNCYDGEYSTSLVTKKLGCRLKIKLGNSKKA